MSLLGSIFLNRRFFLLLTGIILGMVFGFYFSPVFEIMKFLLFGFLLMSLMDLFILFRVKQGILATRTMLEKLSNGDDNPLSIYVENRYGFKAHIQVIDEIPFQFQRRDINFELNLESGEQKSIQYQLRPTKRGVYSFGHINIFVSSPLRLVKRRMKFEDPKEVPVYPSFIQMRKYELLAISNDLVNLGIKKVRRIGHNMEFEQIKDYVTGDDIRTINWKATARRNQLMVNNFQDEKSQQIYSIIDMGRTMEMPFDGMTLLDYAINASLVISNIAIKKDDKAGLISFNSKIKSIVPATKMNNQMFKIQETLYNQETDFSESDYSQLNYAIQTKINQRSLLVLYTNFESRVSMERQFHFIQALARRHVVLVVFFENSEIDTLLNKPPEKVREIYYQAIGEQFILEKKWVVRELNKYGIYTILTKPENLTVNTINKYLELKARGVI